MFKQKNDFSIKNVKLCINTVAQLLKQFEAINKISDRHNTKIAKTSNETKKIIA